MVEQWGCLSQVEHLKAISVAENILSILMKALDKPSQFSYPVKDKKAQLGFV